MRKNILFFLFPIIFCQYIIVKQPGINILSVYFPKAYVENPYKIKLFILNNGTETLEIRNVTIEDVHIWTAHPENPQKIPPGYIGVLIFRTRIQCEDFGKVFQPKIKIEYQNGTVEYSEGKFAPESPILVIYPLAVASNVGEEKRKIIQVINYGSEEKEVNISLQYPLGSFFAAVFSDDKIFKPGVEYLYLSIVPYSSGYLGELNITFLSSCPYLVSPENLIIKVRGILRERGAIILTPEVNLVSVLIFIVLAARAAGLRLRR